jgi:pimeloyl-ACP methyl ester carboxylesterase
MRPLDLAATRTIDVNGLAFPVIDTGHGTPTLLLHGFPDSRHLWRHQIPALTAAGLRVIAPDLRGFGDAPRPEGVEAYRLTHILADLTGLLDALGCPRINLVGHDWGAAIAWQFAIHMPARVERLAALSVGAPGARGWESIEQREKSWYFHFFQTPKLPEAWMQHDDWKLLREWTRGAGDIDRYIADLSRPGALTAGINLYRANVGLRAPHAGPPPPLPITCPVMGLWSDRDAFLIEDQMKNSGERVSGSWRYERVSDASHWMMLDQPATVNRLLVDFLATGR